MADIGFIGAGNMGGPMLANLVKAGHTVTVFDLVQAALDVAKGAGASLAATPGDAATGRDAVITMLPAGASGQITISVFVSSRILFGNLK